MKKRVLALFLAITLSTICIACGNNSASEKDAPTESTSSPENDDSDATGSYTPPAAFEAPMESVNEETVVYFDDSTDDSSGSKASDFDCSVFTKANYSEVCEYAKKVKDLALAKDWKTLGDMINYPVEDADGTVLKSKDDFVKYASTPGFDKTFSDSLSKWSVDAVWFNSQGACINDGSIWFQDYGTNDPEFKIKSFWGFYPQ